MQLEAQKKTLGLKIVAVLALAHAVAGVLRALHWFDVGSDLMGDGLLLLPFVGLVAMGWGMIVALLAGLFVVFACGALMQRSWARWLGISLAIINLLLVLSVVVQGDTPARALVWAIVPVVMLGYLLSAQGRRALKPYY